MTDMMDRPKFERGDTVFMHNGGKEIFTIDRVIPSDAPHRSHKYSVEGINREYYESVFTKVDDD